MKIHLAALAPAVVVSTLTSIAALALSTSHPILGILLETLLIGGSICLTLIWVIPLGKAWGKTIQKRWTLMRTWLHRPKYRKEASDSTIVSVSQLERLYRNIQRLGLALYGMTPEMENACRTHFQLLGETFPPLVLPPQNAILYAEFASLIKTLTHFGFPSLESVRLQQKDLAFIQQWGSDLEKQLQQQQQHDFEQQAALGMALTAVTQQHKMLGETWALAQHHSGYQQIQGALCFLETMVNDSRCQWDLAQTYVQALQSHIETVVCRIN